MAATDRWQSGRTRTPGKRVYSNVTRVRIPPCPPYVQHVVVQQFVLNQLGAHQYVSPRNLENYKRLLREGVNRALNRATGIKQLLVRGQRGVSMALYLKTVEWNIIKAGWHDARRGIAARKMELQAA